MFGTQAHHSLQQQTGGELSDEATQGSSTEFFSFLAQQSHCPREAITVQDLGRNGKAV